MLWSVHIALAALTTAPPPNFRVRAASDSELWPASCLLRETFGGRSLSFLASLKMPSLNANVFFRPVADPVVAVAMEQEKLIGCAQLIRVELRNEVGSGAGEVVAFVQSVAVERVARRRGVARALMAFCEETARDAWVGAMAVDESWLAVATDNTAALTLYESLGYGRRNTAMGNVLLSKSWSGDGGSASGISGRPSRTSRIVACATQPPPSDVPSSAAETPTELPITKASPTPMTALSGGIGFAPLLSNLGVQALYTGVAILGVSFLLAPFGGPGAPNLLGLGAPWHPYDGGLQNPGAWWAAIGEIALGLGVAALELIRQGELPDLTDLAALDGPSDAPTEQLQYTQAQALQMRPLYEIAASEPSLPLAAASIIAWQGTIALAEEMYYRGFVQSAGVLIISWPLRANGVDAGAVFPLFLEGLPLIVSAALFGLVHTEFVEGAGAPSESDAQGSDAAVASPPSPSGVQDTKEFWFRVTALYGALYSLLYTVTGHRLLAPVCAHAGLNVGLCLRDWGRMRRTPAATLQSTFSPSE